MTLSVGALVLSQLLAFTAMAAPKCYSTGPLEQQDSGIVTFWVKVLNNDKEETVQATIVAFDLDGPKRILREFTGALAPLSSDFLVLEVGGTDEYEVQVKLDGEAADDSLLGGFAKNEDNQLVAAHRLVHSEWTAIDCEDFGLATATDG